MLQGKVQLFWLQFAVPVFVQLVEPMLVTGQLLFRHLLLQHQELDRLLHVDRAIPVQVNARERAIGQLHGLQRPAHPLLWALDARNLGGAATFVVEAIAFGAVAVAAKNVAVRRPAPVAVHLAAIGVRLINGKQNNQGKCQQKWEKFHP